MRVKVKVRDSVGLRVRGLARLVMKNIDYEVFITTMQSPKHAVVPLITPRPMVTPKHVCHLSPPFFGGDSSVD